MGWTQRLLQRVSKYAQKKRFRQITLMVMFVYVVRLLPVKQVKRVQISYITPDFTRHGVREVRDLVITTLDSIMYYNRVYENVFNLQTDQVT